MMPIVKSKATTNNLKVWVYNGGSEALAPLRTADVTVSVLVDGETVGTVTAPAGNARRLAPAKATGYGYKWVHPQLSAGSEVEVTTCSVVANNTAPTPCNTVVATVS